MEKMKYRAHVRIDASMCTVGASAHLGSRLDNDVVDDKMVNIQAFDFGVTRRISFVKYDKLDLYQLFTSEVEEGIQPISLANVLE